VKKDKRMYAERLTSGAEKAAEMQNKKVLFGKTKKLAGRNNTCPAVKDKEGKLIRH
jgi:hypothetical protein